MQKKGQVYPTGFGDVHQGTVTTEMMGYRLSYLGCMMQHLDLDWILNVGSYPTDDRTLLVLFGLHNRTFDPEHRVLSH
jgi:hypothetical protein